MFWSFIATHHRDPISGSWWHELGEDNLPAIGTWSGKPDLYHALQATLFARGDVRFGLVEAARRGLLD